MATANCNDRNNVVAEYPRYTYELNVNPPLPACSVERRRCAKLNSARHRNAAGNMINPFDVCRDCKLAGGNITSSNRKLATAPAAAPFDIPARQRLLRGPVDGALVRGRLCNRCTNRELVAYYNRLFVEGQPSARAANTCKCQKEFRKWYCIQDRIAAYAKIQAGSDRNAGPGGWLEHIDYQAATNRATYVNANAALLVARRAAGQADNACRCGRTLPALVGAGATNNVPVPVAACTACSGIIVDITHRRVRRLVDDWPTADGGEVEANMDYGRALH